MNRTWFDRAYGDQLPATLPRVPDERLRALYEADEFDNYRNDTWTIERVSSSWYIYKNGKVPSGPYELLRPFDSRDAAKSALDRWSRSSGQRVFVWECDDSAARPVAESEETQQMISLINAWKSHPTLQGLRDLGRQFLDLGKEDAAHLVRTYTTKAGSDEQSVRAAFYDISDALLRHVKSMRPTREGQDTRHVAEDWMTPEPRGGGAYSGSVPGPGDKTTKLWAKMRDEDLKSGKPRDQWKTKDNDTFLRNARAEGLLREEEVEEAIGFLNTFSTRGSTGVNMTVKKIGSGFFVLFTSGGIVDGVAYGTREEAVAAAKRLAAEEGVRVEEAEGQGTAEQVFAVLRKGAATVEMVADEVGITAEQAQRILDNLQARAMIRRRGDRYFMDQFA